MSPVIEGILSSHLKPETRDEFVQASGEEPSKDTICFYVLMALVELNAKETDWGAEEDERDTHVGVKVEIQGIIGSDYTKLTVQMLRGNLWIKPMIEKSFENWRTNPKAENVQFSCSILGKNKNINAEIIHNHTLRYSIV